MANTWYAYIGGLTGDPTLARNYSRITGKPGCLNGQTICNIYVPDGGITPVSPLPAAVLTYINNGLSTLVAQPQTPAGSKFFVYLKG